MFKDRFDAARQLVPYLTKYANNPNAIILAIPRGGLELGSVLAQELQLPLDVILTKKIVIALPVAPPQAIVRLEKIANEVICLEIPEVFYSVGQFYQTFNQVDDSEAILLLQQARP